MGGADPLADRELVLGTMSTLTKNKEDQKTATEIVKRWLKSRSSQAG